MTSKLMTNPPMINEPMMTSPITAIIVDDEDLARQKIRHFLNDDVDCRILADCANGFKAVEAVCDQVPDVIFLDVQMPELDGFETLRMIRDSLDEGVQMPLVVFITAFDHYALKAFEAHATDYLLKPFDYERFYTMFAGIKHHIQTRKTLSEHEILRRELALLKSAQTSVYTERFAFKTRGRIYFVNTEEVDWIEADRNYALFHVGNLTHIYRSTFGDLEQQLDPAVFLRVHRSAIVQKQHIQEISKRSERSYQVILKNGVALDIGVGYRENVFTAMGLQSLPEASDES